MKKIKMHGFDVIKSPKKPGPGYIMVDDEILNMLSEKKIRFQEIDEKIKNHISEMNDIIDQERDIAEGKLDENI